MKLWNVDSKRVILDMNTRPGFPRCAPFLRRRASRWACNYYAVGGRAHTDAGCSRSLAGSVLDLATNPSGGDFAVSSANSSTGSLTIWSMKSGKEIVRPVPVGSRG